MQLNFKKFGTGHPLIILHGLMGSLDNWQSIAKALAEKFEVYIIDQRNHGKSPHSAEFSYELLAQDLLEFYQQHNIQSAFLMGHSMGGKTAMQFTIEHPDKVDKLILVDIAPSEYEDGHSQIFKALYAAKVASANSREEVSNVLHQYMGNDESTIGFLMKSLSRDESGKHFEWKFNLDALVNNYEAIRGGIIGNGVYNAPTLFIKGERSDYINAANYADITAHFPNNQIAEIKGAGHWVHADNPAEFTAAVTKFLL